MLSRTTVLKTQRHLKFFAANHRDPVTGKVFAAGDRVTLCAACLSPFLEESWIGIGGSHCGQSSTVGIESRQAADAKTNPTEIDSGDNRNCESSAASEATTNYDLLPIPIDLFQSQSGLS
jgi:hypothetical protein